MILWLLIMIPISALFTGLGVFAWKRKQPMWFWSGTTVDEKEITDVRAYNRENGVMWIAFSGIFWLSTVVGCFHMGAGGLILWAGTLAAIPLLILTYRRILKKYSVHP